jgi:outer membrane protein assembly factor BamB
MVDIGAYPKFFGRMIALGLLTLLYAGWWLASRRVPLRDRVLVLAATGAIFFLAMKLVHPSVKGLQLVLQFWAMPAMLTAWTLWLLATRHASRQRVRGGMIAVAALAWAPTLAVRLDGLQGAGDGAFHWRWTPTGEELFLAEHANRRKPAGDAADGSAAGAEQARAAPLVAGPDDWPEFRGPKRDGAVHGVAIRTDWVKNPPQQLWKHRVGPGWSSIVVIGNRLFTQEQREANEAVVCYDADTGDELWVHEDNGRFDEAMGGVGPRATPTFADGRIYALGALGRLNCLDAATGDVVWSHDIKNDGQGAAPYWGFSSSPLVVDGNVIVFAGGGGAMSHGSGNNPEGDDAKQGDAAQPADEKPADAKTLLAYDAATGALAWQAKSGTHSYSSPQAATIDGVQQVLFLSDAELAAFDPATGEVLWKLPTNGDPGRSTPSLQPMLLGDSIVLASFNMDSGVVRASVSREGDAWKLTAPPAPWPSRAIKPFFNDFVRVGDTLYGFDGKIFCSFDAATGERNWKQGRYGSGQVLLIADQPVLLVISEQGEAVLVAADPQKHRELGRFQAIEGKTWNHPTVVRGRLYVRNADEMACYDLH